LSNQHRETSAISESGISLWDVEFVLRNLTGKEKKPWFTIHGEDSSNPRDRVRRRIRLSGRREDEDARQAGCLAMILHLTETRGSHARS